MPAPDLTFDALVLRKTKLGEADLIIHMMDDEGSARKAVAKGARKPRNAGSAKLDLFNVVHVVVAQGRSLNIVKESRLLAHHDRLYEDPVRFSAASVIAEAAYACIQPDLPVESLFAMTKAAFEMINGCQENDLTLAVAAYLLKATAFLGTRPSFVTCACCGCAMSAQKQALRFSYQEGGAICPDCATIVQTMPLDEDATSLCHLLLHSSFKQIAERPHGAHTWDASMLSVQWFQHQVGCHLKSVETFRALVQGAILHAD